jgi:hypothetical protein
MRNTLLHISILVLILFIQACTKEKEALLPSVEQRVTEAVTNLRNELTAPANGWRLEYKPTNASGIFYMVLKFDEDEVHILSDVADNNGEFYDHTIPWRVDNALGLELIYETYGVFHYLFELDAATFGAEFEWAFIEKTGDDLVFTSISDLSFAPSTITLTPAAPDDDTKFSRDIAANLNEFVSIGPKALEVQIPKQQILLEDAGISIYWSLDATKRVITSILAGTGSDFEDPNFEAVILNHQSGYILQNGNLELLVPLQFALAGRAYTIDAINFSEFSNTGPNLCIFSPDDGPLYTGQISGIGSIAMISSLFDLEGTAFLPIPEFPYSVNSFFIFDESSNSLADDGGIIAEKFPGATGFLFYYGFESDTQPSNAVGFILEDALGNSEIILREFEPTETIGNMVRVVLNNNYYFSGTPGLDDQANLEEITNLLFEGGDMYASDFPVEGLNVFKLFNPCNQHEIFLVQ